MQRTGTAIDYLRPALLLRSVVPLTRSHLEPAILRQDFDGAEAAIGNEVCRLVGDSVLAAQFLLNGEERVRHLAHLEGKEGSSTGRIRNAFQNFVALAFHAADVGADGVDDDFGALRHFY